MRMKSMRQKLIQAVLPAILLLPFFGILTAVGYALCPAAMQGGSTITAANHVGWIISRTASAVYDNRGFLFAVCAGYGLSGRKLEGAAAGLIGVLLFNSFSAIPFFLEFVPSVLDSPVDTLALYGPNVCTGILFGMVSSWILNRYVMKDHPVKTLLILMTGILVTTLSVIAVRILLFRLLVQTGTALSALGDFGPAVFAFLNRLTAPFDLHRPLNYAILSEEGIGDMARYWALIEEGDPGRYMSGFFAPMMLGVPAAALMMARGGKAGSIRRLFFVMCAVSAFMGGLCEPFEYWLLLASPLLYIAYSAVYGGAAYISCITGFRAGFACSGGFVDFIFSSAVPAFSKPWIVLPLGAGCALVLAVLFYRMMSDTCGEFDIIEENRKGDIQ